MLIKTSAVPFKFIPHNIRKFKFWSWYDDRKTNLNNNNEWYNWIKEIDVIYRLKSFDMKLIKMYNDNKTISC